MDTPALDASDAAAAGVAKGRRVTLEYLKSRVVGTEYYNPHLCPHMTLCILRVENDYTVIGQSAPADPDNYDKELGERLAYENALGQLWPLEGYLLREELHEHG